MSCYNCEKRSHCNTLETLVGNETHQWGSDGVGDWLVGQTGYELETPVPRSYTEETLVVRDAISRPQGLNHPTVQIWAEVLESVGTETVTIRDELLAAYLEELDRKPLVRMVGKKDQVCPACGGSGLWNPNLKEYAWIDKKGVLRTNKCFRCNGIGYISSRSYIDGRQYRQWWRMTTDKGIEKRILERLSEVECPEFEMATPECDYQQDHSTGWSGRNAASERYMDALEELEQRRLDEAAIKEVDTPRKETLVNEDPIPYEVRLAAAQEQDAFEAWIDQIDSGLSEVIETAALAGKTLMEVA